MDKLTNSIVNLLYIVCKTTDSAILFFACDQSTLLNQVANEGSVVSE